MANVSIIQSRQTRKGLTHKLQIRYDTPKGQVRRYETFYGSLTAARKECNRIQVEIEDGKRVAPSDETFARLIERVYALPAHHKTRGKPKKWAPSGSARVRSAIRCYLSPEGPEEWVEYLDPPGPYKLAKLNTAWWNAFFGRVAARGFKGQASAEGSVARLFVIVHAAYEQAIREGGLVKNPVTNCSIAGEERARVRPPTDEELLTLLGYIRAKDRVFYTYCYLSTDLGHRRGEACALRWEHIDLDDATVAITSRISLGEKGPELLEFTKARDHDFPRRSITPESIELLREQRDRVKERMERAGLVFTPRAWVFPRRDDVTKPFRPDSSVTAKFARFRKQVGLEHISGVHTLRHYVATEMIAQGVDIVTVAGRLGDNPITVSRTYAHWRQQADQAAVASHGKKLAALSKPKLRLVGEE